MPPKPYWIAQAIFITALGVAAGHLSIPLIAAFGLAQFLLVGTRLWDVGRLRWLALVPPALTVGCWVVGMRWAVTRSLDGDGGGLLVAMLTLGLCGLSYAVVGVLAGCLRPQMAAT